MPRAWSASKPQSMCSILLPPYPRFEFGNALPQFCYRPIFMLQGFIDTIAPLIEPHDRAAAGMHQSSLPVKACGMIIETFFEAFDTVLQRVFDALYQRE